MAIGVCVAGVLPAGKPQVIVNWIEKRQPQYKSVPVEKRISNVRLVGRLWLAAGIFFAYVWFRNKP